MVSDDVDGIEWTPVKGEEHRARFPWHHRLDARVGCDFRLADLRTSAFLEVIDSTAAGTCSTTVTWTSTTFGLSVAL